MEPYTFEKIDGEVYAVRNDEYWDQKQKEKYELLLKRSGIPKNYWDLDFDIYEGEKSLDSKNKCEIYAKKCKEEKFHNVNLYLTGEHSSQKSMIACAIGKEFIRQGLQVKFAYGGVLIDLLLKVQGFSYIPEIEEELNKIKNVDLLIIDDIFDIEKGTYWKRSPELVISAWDTFLRSFVHDDRRIVITSNFNAEQIKEKFGVSLYELVTRDFLELYFYDNIKLTRRSRLSESDLFE